MHVKRQLLFVQGGGKGTRDEWDNKLVESLRQELGQDYEPPGTSSQPRAPRSVRHETKNSGSSWY